MEASCSGHNLQLTSLIPTDVQLSQLANNLVKRHGCSAIGVTESVWMALVSTLGLSKADIFRHREENRYNEWGQCFYALIRWKQREFKHATIERLLNACQRCNITPSAYNFLQ